jgi:hypothetical protein
MDRKRGPVRPAPTKPATTTSKQKRPLPRTQSSDEEDEPPNLIAAAGNVATGSKRKMAKHPADSKAESETPNLLVEKGKLANDSERKMGQDSKEESEPLNLIAAEGKLATHFNRQRQKPVPDSETAYEMDAASPDESDEITPPAQKPRGHFLMQISGEEALDAIIQLRLTLSQTPDLELWDRPRGDCHIALRRPSKSHRWMLVCLPQIVANPDWTQRVSIAQGALYLMRFTNTNGAFARIVPADAKAISCVDGDVLEQLWSAHPRIAPYTSDAAAKALIAIYDERVAGGGSNLFQLMELQPKLIAPLEVKGRAQKRHGKSVGTNIKRVGICQDLYVPLIALLKQRSDIQLVMPDFPDFHFLIGHPGESRFIAVSLSPGLKSGGKRTTFFCRAVGVTYLFRGKVNSSGVSDVTRFVPGRPGGHARETASCVDGDLTLPYRPFYPALGIGSVEQLSEELCKFALAQCRKSTGGFEVKSLEEWDPLKYWEIAEPVDMSEDIEKDLLPEIRTEMRSHRYFTSLTTALNSYEARESSPIDRVIELPRGSVNAGKYLAIQMKATDCDRFGEHNLTPRLHFNTHSADGEKYLGQLMILIALHRGLIWAKPYVQEAQADITERDQTWRRFYVKRGTLSERLREIVESLGRNECDDLKAFTLEEIQRPPTKKFAIEQDQIERLKQWSGLIFESVARWRYDAKIHQMRIQFKTTAQQPYSCLNVRRYRQDDFEAIIFVAPHCFAIIPSAVLAQRGLVNDARSIITGFNVKHNENGCYGPEWLLPYARKFDDEGIRYIRQFFGMDEPVTSPLISHVLTNPVLKYHQKVSPLPDDLNKLPCDGPSGKLAPAVISSVSSAISESKMEALPSMALPAEHASNDGTKQCPWPKCKEFPSAETLNAHLLQHAQHSRTLFI